uniref:BED-type domain-containing protein n=1 Tax=Globodera rostochiensis TaxID=31243 RepID=A0A914I851_GLORO
MSEVWNHFFMASNGLSVTCNHCGKFMKRSDSSTKSMWGHLKAFHADLVGEETFRLKRTRRMRGEGGGGGSKTKTASAKTPKSVDGKSIGGGKTRKKLASPEATMTSCSSGSSFSSASSSSGGEELDELEGPSEFSSRASSQEVGECVERTLCVGMEEMKGEMEERKDEDEEEERRKNVLTPPMTVASVKREGVVAKPEVRETPTQPYVKRKRPHHREQQQQQANERVEEPASQTASIAVNQQSAAAAAAAAAAAEQQNGAVAKPPPSPTMSVSCHGASSANAIPCSASSAFSKYSTAALLMDSCLGNGGCSVGTTSPSHGAEAPKQYSREATQPSQLQPQPLPAPRPKYGLEAITGLDTTAHLATDPEMLANLEVAVTMNRLVNEYHHQQQKNNLNAVQAQQVQNVHQQQKTTQNGSGQHQQNSLGQQLNGQQLNELLAIYAASVTASALQHQQQKGTDQQQLVAQQAAAAVSWLYNWEWMAAATAAAGTQQQQKPVNGLNMSGAPMSKKRRLGGKMGGNVAKFAGGNNGAVNAGAVQPKSGLNNNNNNSLANGMETKQNHQQQNNNHHQLAQKRKSPAEERDCAASLLVLADTASTAAVEQQQRGSASPPKSRKMGELCKKQQQQQQDNHNDGCCSGADGAGEALAESLVLYGMHRIAMELQLSYSVHGNKAGRAEYAFYCTNTGTANANVQRMVTLTESADQVLHIREYANGTVVAEECWPKSAEPGTLLLSLRDKCQRRLCA